MVLGMQVIKGFSAATYLDKLKPILEHIFKYICLLLLFVKLVFQNDFL
jgi:hypothetical protein